MIEHFDAHDLIALVIIVGGLVLYFLRPNQEVLAIITMIAGFYFGRNNFKNPKKQNNEKNTIPPQRTS
jgi:Na+/H+ antiporter NhaC